MDSLDRVQTPHRQRQLLPHRRYGFLLRGKLSPETLGLLIRPMGLLDGQNLCIPGLGEIGPQTILFLLLRQR